MILIIFSVEFERELKARNTVLIKNYSMLMALVTLLCFLSYLTNSPA